MPFAVRGLLLVMVAFTAILSIQNGSSWLHMPPALFEWLYNTVLIGSAVLCFARAWLGRSERTPWMFMGGALALYAAGNIYLSLIHI